MSQSELRIREIEAKTILHRNKPHLPWKWDLNLYRGCAHRCVYCFARYSHSYLESDNFFEELFVKTNAPQLLEKKLSSRAWKGEMINLGGVTDCSQPIDKQYNLTAECLRVIEKYPTPLNITTKSDLLRNEAELLSRIAAKVPVQVNVSITAHDPELQQLLEPGASSTEARFRLLEVCKAAGCTTRLFLVPVLPFLTDDGRNLKRLMKRAAEAEVDGVVAWTLDITGSTRKHYSAFLSEHFPDKLAPTLNLFADERKLAGYRRNLFVLVANLMEQYSLSYPEMDNSCLGNPGSKPVQLSLFD